MDRNNKAEEERRILFKIASHLLEYPPDTFLPSFHDWEGLLAKLPPVPAANKFRVFLKYFRETPRLRLQEEYTRTFDFNPSACLNLTYHRCGEGKDRGGELLSLKDIYLAAGYELAGGELPDFLPLILEFMAAAEGKEAGRVLRDYGSSVAILAARLREQGSPYAGLLEGIQELFSEESARRGGEDG
jgi:nitrate reductase delta subunit